MCDGHQRGHSSIQKGYKVSELISGRTPRDRSGVPSIIDRQKYLLFFNFGMKGVIEFVKLPGSNGRKTTMG